MESFGFTAPILIDKDGQIIAGHARLEAAKYLRYAEVPVICLDHLSPEQARAYMLADNKLTDRSSWNDEALAVHLKELSELALDFDIEATGFELPVIDFRIQSNKKSDYFGVNCLPACRKASAAFSLNLQRISAPVFQTHSSGRCGRTNARLPFDRLSR
jgi:ParB-like nuclease domain